MTPLWRNWAKVWKRIGHRKRSEAAKKAWRTRKENAVRAELNALLSNKEKNDTATTATR